MASAAAAKAPIAPLGGPVILLEWVTRRTPVRMSEISVNQNGWSAPHDLRDGPEPFSQSKVKPSGVRVSQLPMHTNLTVSPVPPLTGVNDVPDVYVNWRDVAVVVSDP